MNAVSRHAHWLAAALGAATLAAYAVAALPRQPAAGKPDLLAFGTIPAVGEGRTKPLDTVARNSLMTVSGDRQTFKDRPYGDDNATEQPAIRWLLEVWGGKSTELFDGPATKYEVFRIEDLEIVSLLDLKQKPLYWRYSLDEMAKNFDKLMKEFDRVDDMEAKNRNPFEQHVYELVRHIHIYEQLVSRREPRVLPPSATGGEWRSIAEADLAITQPYVEGEKEIAPRIAAELVEKLKKENIDPANFGERQKRLFADLVNRTLAPERAELADKLRSEQAPAAAAFVGMAKLYKAGDYDGFNRAVADYKAKYLGDVPPAALQRVGVEAFFNRFAPFYQCLTLYVVAFLLGCLSWAVGEPLRRAAVGLALVAFVLHTAALLTRMYLMDRPLVFVTNLYSSAVFIGWLSAALGLAVEFIFRNGVGAVLTAVTASLSLVIAHFLGMDGDTLGVMQAVLDTNFWLATHVTVVTFGYAATYVAGFVALAYIVLGVLTPWLRSDLSRSLASVTYGIICFATLLSFTGTVLGGIWADQSWGRFWGWDPKENGALLIVIWNALILHARWSGMVKQRGVAVLAVLGNIVTTWSWFGTNQLGVGLHAYGFRSGMAFWIVASSLVFFGVAMLGALVPQRSWQSFAVTAAGPRPKSQGRRTPAKIGAT